MLFKKTMKIILCVLLALILIVLSYVIYVFASYYRIEDNLSLEVIENGKANAVVSTDEPLSLLSWNIGFGAYTNDYSFFMDGGKYSRGFSEDAVSSNINEMASFVNKKDWDYIMLQEIDIDSTRSYHINQKEIFDNSFNDMDSTFALNYDSPYLFWPLLEPHGKSVAGVGTYSSSKLTSAIRRSLPIQEDFAKLIDLDRCYSISRTPVKNGKELVLVNFHLSAYTTDPTIANQQLEMLYDDLKQECLEGNYVICAGDFNKDLLGDSSKYFGISGEDYSWAKSFPFDTLPEGISLVAPIDIENPIPSCRNADQPWDKEKVFQITIDGFMVSDNVNVIRSNVLDTDFRYSDHNPVYLEFTLADA